MAAFTFKGSMFHNQRLFLERSLAAEASKTYQSAEDHSDWEKCGFTFRSNCHYDKIFAVWQHIDGAPVILGRIRVRDFDLDSREGLGVCVESNLHHDDGEDMEWVTNKPLRLFDTPIFAHVPFMAEVSFTPENSKPDTWIVRVPVVFKTESNPRDPKEGHIYVTAISEFRATYPQYKDLKL